MAGGFKDRNDNKVTWNGEAFSIWSEIQNKFKSKSLDLIYSPWEYQCYSVLYRDTVNTKS